MQIHTKALTLRIPKELLVQLSKLARQARRSRAAFVREILEKAVKNSTLAFLVLGAVLMLLGLQAHAQSTKKPVPKDCEARIAHLQNYWSVHHTNDGEPRTDADAPHLALEDRLRNTLARCPEEQARTLDALVRVDLYQHDSEEANAKVAALQQSLEEANSWNDNLFKQTQAAMSNAFVPVHLKDGTVLKTEDELLIKYNDMVDRASQIIIAPPAPVFTDCQRSRITGDLSCFSY